MRAPVRSALRSAPTRPPARPDRVRVGSPYGPGRAPRCGRRAPCPCPPAAVPLCLHAATHSPDDRWGVMPLLPIRPGACRIRLSHTKTISRGSVSSGVQSRRPGESMRRHPESSGSHQTSLRVEDADHPRWPPARAACLRKWAWLASECSKYADRGTRLKASPAPQISRWPHARHRPGWERPASRLSPCRLSLGPIDS